MAPTSFAGRAFGVLRLDPATFAGIAAAAPRARRQAIVVVLVAGFPNGLEANGPTMVRVATRDGDGDSGGLLLFGVVTWAIAVVLALGFWSFLTGAVRLVGWRGPRRPSAAGPPAAVQTAIAWAFLPSWFGLLGSVSTVGPWAAGLSWVWGVAVFVAAVQAALGVPLRRAAVGAADVAGIVLVLVLLLVLLVYGWSSARLGPG